jgi:hypothetical protein
MKRTMLLILLWFMILAMIVVFDLVYYGDRL